MTENQYDSDFYKSVAEEYIKLERENIANDLAKGDTDSATNSAAFELGRMYGANAQNGQPISITITTTDVDESDEEAEENEASADSKTDTGKSSTTDDIEVKDAAANQSGNEEENIFDEEGLPDDLNEVDDSQPFYQSDSQELEQADEEEDDEEENEEESLDNDNDYTDTEEEENNPAEILPEQIAAAAGVAGTIGDASTPIDIQAQQMQEALQQQQAQQIQEALQQKKLLEAQRLRQANEAALAAKQSQEANMLVRGADWVQSNIFETLSGVPVIGWALKAIGNVVTGGFKFLGQLFDGNIGGALSTGLSWLQDSAIVGSSFGIYKLGKSLNWWGKKKSNTSTASTEQQKDSLSVATEVQNALAGITGTNNNALGAASTIASAAKSVSTSNEVDAAQALANAVTRSII